MKKFLLAFLLLTSISYSQTVAFLTKGDTLHKPKYQQFIYLCDSTDLKTTLFVGRIGAFGSLQNVSQLFYAIKSKAQEKGANGFKVESFSKIDDKTGELVLSTYFCNDSLFDANFEYIPKNKIYIFGFDDLTSTTAQGYKVNGEKYSIPAGHFKAFDIKEGVEYKINKGGFTGMTYWIKRKQYGYSSFLSFSGIGVNGAEYNYAGGVGVSINTGKINNIEPNLALALLRIYNEQQ